MPHSRGRSGAGPPPERPRPTWCGPRRPTYWANRLPPGHRCSCSPGPAQGRIELVSFDGTTGRRNFAVPFHPGGTPTGVALTPKATRTDAGREIVLTRRSAGAPLEALDARTGAVVRTTELAIDDYDACSDGHDVCWSGYDGGSDRYGPLPGGGPVRWDLETGRLRENDGQDGAMQVGTDLYFRGDGRTSVPHATARQPANDLGPINLAGRAPWSRSALRMELRARPASQRLRGLARARARAATAATGVPNRQARRGRLHRALPDGRDQRPQWRAALETPQAPIRGVRSCQTSPTTRRSHPVRHRRERASSRRIESRVTRIWQ